MKQILAVSVLLLLTTIISWADNATDATWCRESMTAFRNAIAVGDKEAAKVIARKHERKCETGMMPDECNLFDQFDDDLDTFTPEKSCSLYCPETWQSPAYCKLKSQKYLEEEQTIYDNCVIAKGSNLMNNQAFDSIKKSCERISKKPSFLQKLRWGS